MRNGGILGGLFPDDGQDLAFRDLTTLGEPAWAQAARDLMARSAQGSAAARDYPVPSQPSPWFPSAPSAANPWPAPSQPTTDPYLNSQAQGPAWLGDSTGNPPPLLHELPYFATGLSSSPPQTDNSQGNLSRFGLTDENRLSKTMQATPSAPVVTAGFRGGVSVPYPGFAPASPDLDIEKWWDHTKRGHIGLWNYLRSFTGSGVGDPDGPGCKEEWDDARKQCAEWIAGPNPPRGPTGNYKTIEECAPGLVSERCGGSPYERDPKKRRP
jgi:hypothetical protein